MMYDPEDYVPVDECARWMNITEAEVMVLIAQRALKARRYAGWGQLEVQPAITNVEPRKRRLRSARPRRLSGGLEASCVIA